VEGKLIASAAPASTRRIADAVVAPARTAAAAARGDSPAAAVLASAGSPRHQVGLVPKQLWRDRVLHEAHHTADPVHLIRLFGIHPSTAVKYVNAAHPDKALPRVR
jgi:hypothetical protein